MMGNTTGADILEAVLECLSRLGLDLARLSALTTDGAPSMVGGNKGFLSLMVKHCQDRGFKQPIKKLHCIVHQESAKMRSVMSVAVKVVNFGASITGSFATCWWKPTHSMMTYCTIARCGGSVVDVCWSGCITCERRCLLSYAARVRTFLNLTILVGVCDLAFLTDITSHLNDLNVQLQGKDILMPDMVSRITAFEDKLRLWESQLMKLDFIHFKRLHACSPEDVSVHVGIVIQLREEFSARFSDLRGYRDDFKLFTSPFDVDVESAPSEVQMGPRWSAVPRWTEVTLCCCRHADFWRKHILPTKRFPGLVWIMRWGLWLHSASLIAVSSCSPGWSCPNESPGPSSQMVIWMTCCCYLFHLLHKTFHLLVRRSSIKFHIDWFRIINSVFYSNKCISGLRPPQLWLFFLLHSRFKRLATPALNTLNTALSRRSSK